MAKKKYYVVWEGFKRGIFDSWASCETQVKGFAGARFKSFPTLAEAEKAFEQGFSAAFSEKKKSNAAKANEAYHAAQKPSLTVDAACSGNPGDLEYRGVIFPEKIEIFHQGVFPEGTVNIGEFLALVHGLAYLKQKELNWAIYSDSKTAIAWIRNKKVKTTLQKTPKNQKLFELIDRAIIWLENNEYETEILKWKTQEWGEIPADFGRK